MRRRGEEPAGQTEVQPWQTEHPGERPPGKAELTIIGGGARLEGNLISAASLRIEGSVKGQITAEGDVIVASGSEVAADVRATNVTIGGHYTGNVTASGTLELESTAKVEGNLSCQTLVVNRGAVFSGQSIMGGDSSSQIPDSEEHESEDAE